MIPRTAALTALAASVMLLVPAIAPSQSIGSTAWIKKQASVIQTGAGPAQQAARQELIRVADSSTTVATYATAAAGALLPVARNGNARAKVNAAIVAEHLAAKTQSPSLVPVATALLDDASEAVVLWGLKTARPLIASGGAAAATLAPQVAAAVKAHPDSGPIAEEAYATLIPTDDARAAVKPASIPAVLDILELRIPRYANGGAPPSPVAEAGVPVFLSVDSWSMASNADRKRILTDLASLACAAAQSVSDGNASPAIRGIARDSASGLEAIGTRLNNAGLAAAAKAMGAGGLSNAGQLDSACQSLSAAARAAATGL